MATTVRPRKAKRAPPEINIVPFMDVMLVLLIIFMVTAPMLTQGVDVDLPKATTKAIDDADNEPIVLSVDAQGQYYLNISQPADKPMDVMAIARTVKEALTADPDRAVLVKGDQEVSYGKVVAAMVVLQQAGAPSVGLLTRTPDGLPPAEKG
jgi:biopolymer transport protein TolR